MTPGALETSDRYRLCIGGIHVEVVSEDGSPIWAPDPISRFLIPEGDPAADCRVGVRRVPSRAELPAPVGPTVFESGALWREFDDHGDSLYLFASALYNGEPYRTARFRADHTSGEVLLRADCLPEAHPPFPLEYPLDEILFGRLLGLREGVELHALGVVDERGHGIAFVGHSGAGKSTLGRLWVEAPGARILSDDRVIVRHYEGRWWLHGTPWQGEAALSEAARAPLAALCFLRQTPEPELQPRRGALAAAELLARAFLPYHRPAALDLAAGVCARLAASIPVWDYGFTRTAARTDVPGLDG